jgi:hypothetical protein
MIKVIVSDIPSRDDPVGVQFQMETIVKQPQSHQVTLYIS